jgi:hypothetical protein
MSGWRHAAGRLQVRGNPGDKAVHQRSPCQGFRLNASRAGGPIDTKNFVERSNATMNEKFESNSNNYDESNLNRPHSVPGARPVARTQTASDEIGIDAERDTRDTLERTLANECSSDFAKWPSRLVGNGLEVAVGSLKRTARFCPRKQTSSGCPFKSAVANAGLVLSESTVVRAW